MRDTTPAVPDVAIPNVVVVDPRFDAYRDLANRAREGRLHLQLRCSCAEALRLRRRVHVDAWLIAGELEDMSGHDLVRLLRADPRPDANERPEKIVMVEPARPGGRQWTVAQCGSDADADELLARPVVFADLERILGLHEADPRHLLTVSLFSQAVVTLPVGIAAAAVAVFMLFTG